MKNSNKISILLIFIIALFINGCSERFLSDFLNGVQQPGSNDNQATGGGGNSGSTGSNGDSGSTGGSGDSGSTGGNGDSDSTGGSGDSGSTGGADSGDTGGGSGLNPGDYIGGWGSGGIFPSCDPGTAERPIKRLIAGASDKKIYFSDDFGVTWIASRLPQGLLTKNAWQAFEDLGNNIVLAGSNTVLNGSISGGSGIIKSTDGGKTWEKTNIINSPAGGISIRDFLHIGSGIVIAAADLSEKGGIWRSTDYGETWNQNIHKNSVDYGETPETADGISSGLTSGLALLPDGRILVTRSQIVNGRHNPIYFSEDKGVTWYSPVTEDTWIPARGSGETIVLHNGTVLLAGQANGMIPYSFNPYNYWGWSGITNGKDANGNDKRVGFESIVELRDGAVIAGGYSVSAADNEAFDIPGIWRSTNYGVNFHKVYEDFGWRSLVSLDNCTAIAACMDVGHAGNTEPRANCDGLYSSTDKGTTWNKMTGLSGFEISSIIAIR